MSDLAAVADDAVEARARHDELARRPRRPVPLLRAVRPVDARCRVRRALARTARHRGGTPVARDPVLAVAAGRRTGRQRVPAVPAPRTDDEPRQRLRPRRAGRLGAARPTPARSDRRGRPRRRTSSPGRGRARHGRRRGERASSTRRRAADEVLAEPVRFLCELKIDGVAINLVYRDGRARHRRRRAATARSARTSRRRSPRSPTCPTGCSSTTRRRSSRSAARSTTRPRRSTR